MAQAVIGAIRVNLGMDSAQFENGMKRTSRKMDAFNRKMAGIGKAVAASFAVVGAAAGAAFMKMSADVDNMAKSAQQIGVPIEELTALRHAADLSGVSFDKLKTGMGQFSRTISDTLTGASSEGVKALQRLNIPLKDNEGNLKTTAHLLEDVADRFQAMPDGANKTALAMQLFGRAGRDMIPMLNQGSAGMAKMQAEAGRLGLVISSQTGKQAEQFNDNLTRMQGVLRGVAQAIFARVVPTMVQLSERFLAAMKEGGGFEGVVNAITGAFNAMVRVAGLVSRNLEVVYTVFKAIVTAKIVTGIVSISTAFFKLAQAIKVAGVAMGGFVAVQKLGMRGILAIAGGVALLSGKFEELQKGMDKLWELGGRLIPKELKDNVNNMFGDIEGKQASISVDLEKLSVSAQSAAASFKPLNTATRALGNSLHSVKVDDAWKGLRNVKDAASAATDQVKPLATSLQSAFGSWIDSALDGTFKLKDALGDLTKQLTKMLMNRALEQLFNSIPGLGGGINFPGKANGGFSSGGLTMVGERGPELVNLPSGSYVTPNTKMPEYGGGGTNTFHIDARGAQQGVGEEIKAALAAYDRGAADRSVRHVKNYIGAGGSL